VIGKNLETKTPPKVKNFLWIIFRVCLPTRVLLIDRGFIAHLCVWCAKFEQVASTIWSSILKSRNLRVWQQVIESCNQIIERVKHMLADWKWVNNNKVHNG